MNRPFTIEELLVHTFAPHDDHVYVATDGLSLLGMNQEGKLIVIAVPEGKNFNEMNDDDVNQVIIDNLK